MQVCTLLQTDNHAITPPLSFFTGRMPFLPPNQQRQSTEGAAIIRHVHHNSPCPSRRPCTSYKKLCCRRRTARCAMSVETLPTVLHNCRNKLYMYNKSTTIEVSPEFWTKFQREILLFCKCPNFLITQSRTVHTSARSPMPKVSSILPKVNKATGYMYRTPTCDRRTNRHRHRQTQGHG